jgi:HAMP domain-containing protein
MQILFFLILCLGLLTAVIGSFMILVAAFRQHALWGLAYLFVPLASLVFLIAHWGEARKGFLLSLAGLLIVAASVFAMPGDMRDTFIKESQFRTPPGMAKSSTAPAAAAQNLSVKIQTQRDRIEALEGQFAQMSGQLSQRYNALAATRKALKPGDEAAVARFNEEAAVYQQQTATQRRMQQDLNAAREELDGLLAERTKATAGSRPASNGAVPGA